MHTHGIRTFTALFWFKAITLGLIYYFVNSYKKHELYYYKNLGFSKLKLWIPLLIFDFTVFLTAMITMALKIHETQA